MATLAAPNSASTSPFAAAWAVAVTEQSAGTAAPQAMYDIYQKFPPGTHGSKALQMAKICGYVWADTYWTGIQMDPASLASDMTSAMHWDAGDCALAATTAFQAWAGIFVRKSVEDVGTIPYPAQDFCASPDAVCNGNDTLHFAQLLNNWDLYANQAVPEDHNYLYARAQVINFGAPIPSTTTAMYISPGGFNVGPQSWQVCTPPADTALTLADGKTTVLNNGDHAAVKTDANNVAFQWEDPSSQHFCAVSVVSTPFFTRGDPILSIASNWNSATWAINNGAAGWNNLFSQSSPVTLLRFDNQDTSSERFVFRAETSGVPAGTRIALAVDDDTLPAPISATGIVGSDGSVVTAAGVIPPRYQGRLKVTVHVPGSHGDLLPAGARVHVRLLWEIPAGHNRHFEAFVRFGGARSAPQHFPLGDVVIAR